MPGIRSAAVVIDWESHHKSLPPGIFFQKENPNAVDLLRMTQRLGKLQTSLSDKVIGAMLLRSTKPPDSAPKQEES